MELIKTFYNSFGGKDTKIYQDKHGQIFIENGCQKFAKDKLFKVCQEFNVDLSYIEEISDTIGLSLKEYVTENPNAFYAKVYQAKYGTTEDLDVLVQDKSGLVRETVTKSINVTKEHLDILVKDEFYRVRAAVAKSIHVTKEHLDILVKDEYWFVREDVAQNPHVTKEHLDILVKDEDEDVRFAVAQSPNVTKEHLEILVKDEEWYVREAVAKNPNVTKEHLDMLVKDEYGYVRLAAKNSLQKLLEEKGFLKT